ncbi:MAG: serine/threonine-protein kinase [Polyangiaceae bacterium]
MALRLEEGDLLQDRYRIGPILGKGGMALVVSAVAEDSGHRVAIKFLAPEVAEDPQVNQRFEREARAAARLKSRHVPIVFDSGKVDGAFFLVMEILDGCDLDKFLESGRKLPISGAVDVVLMACDAMAEAHSLGIVHRDLKPSNLFLAGVHPDADKATSASAPTVKVLDFGLSKSIGPHTVSGGLTSTNDVFGSPLYMSPEQLVASGKVDSRTDIWALGVVLYELLTAITPFEAETMVEVWSNIMLKPAAPLRSHRPDLPEDLERAVLKCLEKDPAQRYRTIADLAEALAPFGSSATKACVARARALEPEGVEPPMSLVRPPLSRREPIDQPADPLADTASAATASKPPPTKPTRSSLLPPYLRKSKRTRNILLALAALGVAAALAYWRLAS